MEMPRKGMFWAVHVGTASRVEGSEVKVANSSYLEKEKAQDRIKPLSNARRTCAGNGKRKTEWERNVG
jgi:hypothetical protein